MTSVFVPIREDFEEELQAIRAVVGGFSDPASAAPKARVAAVNAATLLLAATFEEFVREMARAHARAVVEQCNSIDDLPPKLAATAWKRSMEALAKLKPDARDGVFSEALARFNIAYDFCKGDITKDIYQDLIHNENNMRPAEMNGLFKIGGISNICLKICDKQHILALFGDTRVDTVHGLFIKALESFFERRNQIAHSINLMRSSAPGQLVNDVAFLSAVGLALSDTLDQSIPIQNAIVLGAAG